MRVILILADGLFRGRHRRSTRLTTVAPAPILPDDVQVALNRDGTFELVPAFSAVAHELDGLAQVFGR